MKVLFRILSSRLKEENKKEEKIISKRRLECFKCPYNSKNMDKIPLNKRVLKFFSDLLTIITIRGIKEDVLGNCTKCDSCSIFYKTREVEYEDCPDNRWK